MVTIETGAYRDKVWGLSTDVFPTNVRNASVAYVMDWKELSDKQRTALGAQVWMFDAKNKRWLPQ